MSLHTKCWIFIVYVSMVLRCVCFKHHLIEDSHGMHVFLLDIHVNNEQVAETCREGLGTSFMEYEPSTNDDVIKVIDVLNDLKETGSVWIKSRYDSGKDLDKAFSWASESVDSTLWFSYTDLFGYKKTPKPDDAGRCTLLKKYHRYWNNWSSTGKHMLGTEDCGTYAKCLCVESSTKTTTSPEYSKETTTTTPETTTTITPETTIKTISTPETTTKTTTTPETTTKTTTTPETTTKTTTTPETTTKTTTTPETTTKTTTTPETTTKTTTTPETTTKTTTTPEITTKTITTQETKTKTTTTPETTTKTTTTQETKTKITTTPGTTTKTTITPENTSETTTTPQFTTETTTTTPETTSETTIYTPQATTETTTMPEDVLEIPTTTQHLISETTTTSHEIMTKTDLENEPRPRIPKDLKTLPVVVCPCSCPKQTSLPTNASTNTEFVKTLTNQIQQNLTLTQNALQELSTTVRKKTSAKDDRPTSHISGVMAIVVVTLIFCVIAISDVLTHSRFITCKKKT